MQNGSIGSVTITVTCHLCGGEFEVTHSASKIDDCFTLMPDGTYSGEISDYWCLQCECEDQERVTKDWCRR